MRISDWSSDVCSSDLSRPKANAPPPSCGAPSAIPTRRSPKRCAGIAARGGCEAPKFPLVSSEVRSEEHTSELQSLMRISYAVFCLTKKNHNCEHTKSITIYSISKLNNTTQHILHRY